MPNLPQLIAAALTKTLTSSKAGSDIGSGLPDSVEMPDSGEAEKIGTGMPTPSARVFKGLAMLLTGTLLASLQQASAQSQTLASATISAAPPKQESLRMDPAPVPDRLQKVILAKDYDGALDMLSEMAVESPAHATFFEYLRGSVLKRAGRTEAALSTWEELEQQFQAKTVAEQAADGSKHWVSKARFAQADLLTATGRWSEAEVIYEQEAQRLASTDRRRALAQILMERAELSMAPVESPAATEPDYDAAFALYERILSLSPPFSVRLDARFAMAECRRLQEQWPAAAESYQLFLQIAETETTVQAGLDPEGPTRSLRARLERGRALNASQNQAAARVLLEDLVREVDQLQSGEATQAQLVSWKSIAADAAFAIAETYGQSGLDQNLLGIAALTRYLEAFPQHNRRHAALFQIAKREQQAKRWAEAKAAFDDLLAAPLPQADAGSEQAVKQLEEARGLQRLAQFQRGEVEFKRGNYSAAIEIWERYLQNFPSGEDWEFAQRRVIEGEYARATALANAKKYVDAREQLGTFIQSHPLHENNRAIQLQIAQLFDREAQDMQSGDEASAAAKQLWLQAAETYQKIVSKYPDSDTASDALFRLASLYEQRLQELPRAVETYRECSFGSRADDARQRLALLGETELIVLTERSWRSDEAALLTVDTRNLEDLNVEVYALDLEAYFRKHLTHAGVADLDIDLISPDRSFNVSVADYEPYRSLQQKVDLELPEAGVWAVRVTSDKKQATTLVLKSDIDLITKSSRRELFVFAQDRIAEGPAANVRILAAVLIDGQVEFQELTTAEDGVARWKDERLGSAQELRLLGLRGEHVASAGLTIANLQLSPELQPRGFVYTDRPAYQPGQSISWRGIFRDVEAGNYRFQPGTPYRVRLMDSMGRALIEQRLELNEFGSISGQFDLAESAPEGNYQVLCQSGDQNPVAASFQVERYTLQKERLSISFDQTVVYRGEEVSVRLKADTYFGTPVAGAEYSLQLPDQRTLTGKTDAEGLATVSFSTRDFTREGPLSVFANLPAQGLQDSAQVYVAQRGFALQLELLNRKVLANEVFELGVSAQTPDGSQIAVETEYVLSRKDQNGATLEVERGPITTGADRNASKSFQLQEPGQYHLRVSAVDRFGNLVTAKRILTVLDAVNGDELLFLTERQNYSVGETAEATLVNQVGDGLALMTIEAEGILEYALLDLKAGPRALAIPIQSDHAPGIQVAIAAMRGNRFFSQNLKLNVARSLSVSIETDQATYKPGQEVSAVLTSTDAVGQAVPSELSLAVVDEALYELYAALDPNVLAQVFAGGSRLGGGVETRCTADFDYPGVTTEIAGELLLEGERQEALEARNKELARARLSLDAGEEALSELSIGLVRKSAAGPASPGRADGDYLFGISGGAGGGRYGGKNRSQTAQMASALRERLSETAYWTANVRTDSNGRAELKFPLPSTNTTWRLISLGCGREAVFGGAQASIVSRADFFLELAAPASLTEGDAPGFAVRAHNTTDRSGKVEVRLQVAGAGLGQSWTRSTSWDVEANSSSEYLFEGTPKLGSGEVIAEAEGEALLNGQSYSDGVRERFDVRPFSVQLVDSFGGSLDTGRSRMSTFLQLSAGDYSSRKLEVHVGPRLYALLVESALGKPGLQPLRTQSRSLIPQADRASQLWGALEVLRVLDVSSSENAVTRAALQTRVQGLIAQLLSSQTPQGDWNWAEQRSAETSAFALWSLGKARAQAFSVPQAAIDNGVKQVRAAFRDADQRNDELKALLQMALASVDTADFGALNRLHRSRQNLSPAALAFTTLALAATERMPMARELADLLEERARELPAARGSNLTRCTWPTDNNGSWNRSAVEQTAWSLLALGATKPNSQYLARASAYLESTYPWSGWGYGSRAAGIALAALAKKSSDFVLGRRNCAVKLQLRDLDSDAVQTFDFSSEQSSAQFERILEQGLPERLQLDFEMLGSPREIFVSARLTGTTRDIPFNQRAGGLRLQHDAYQAVPAPYEGRAVQSGFDSVTSEVKRWDNEISQLRPGQEARCKLYYSWDRGELKTKERTYVEVEIPIPAGAIVLENSIGGSVRSFEVRQDKLVVMAAANHGSSRIDYSLVGSRPGDYSALPASMQYLYQSDVRVFADARKLKILAPDERSSDPYRPTPDERLHGGSLAFEDGRWDLAWKELRALQDEFGAYLRDKQLAQATRMLLTLAIQREDSAEIVRAFEVLKEKDPLLTIPFDEILAVGQAYRSMGEYERALLIFRATIAETFGRDLKVAGILEEQNEFATAVDVYGLLTAEYPDQVAVVETSLAHAEKLIAKSAEAHNDKSLRRTGISGPLLSLESILRLRGFLCLHPDNPLAAEAGLGLISAQLSLENYEEVADLGQELADVYSKPRFKDAFLYSRAVALWNLNREEDAIALLERIANTRYPANELAGAGSESSGVKGETVPSQNRDLALYILAQIHHAQRDVSKAEQYYGQVRELFADAEEALKDLSAKQLSFAEITESSPGESVALKLTHRNLEDVELLAYRVDLLTLALREKTLSEISSVNLSGIEPTFRRQISLQAESRLFDSEASVNLDFEQPGAYLVIARGEELFASGLVLVSDLALTVREDSQSGELRVQARNKRDDGFVRGVDVRVIGSSNSNFQAGQTDPRGLFAANGLSGMSTVIARMDGEHYAFHRGAQSLGRSTRRKRPMPSSAQESLSSQAYFQNVFELNDSNMQGRAQWLQDETKKDRAGVQIQQVK